MPEASPGSTDSTRAALLADPEIERLCQGLALASGFALSLVVTPCFGLTRVLPSLVAERASEISQASLRATSLTLSHRFEPTETEVGFMRAVEQAWEKLDGLSRASEELLFVTLAEPATSDDPFWRVLFRIINERRNGLTERLGRPLCLMLGPKLEALLTEHAPDFWSIRSHTRLPTVSPTPVEALGQPLVEKLQPLRRLLWDHENAVLPVVGSGLSQGLPSWRALLSSLIDELPEAERGELREQLDKEKFLEAASYLEEHPAVGRRRVIAKVQDCYQRPKLERPEIYDQLVKLPVAHYVTTNYDPWLKNALSQRLSEVPRIYGPLDDGAFSDIAPSSPPLVLMIHGDADRPNTCVLSEVGYRDLSHGSPAWREGMRQLIGHRHLFFVGYSLSDPDILDLLLEWQAVFAPQGEAPRHFLIDAGITKSRINLLRQRGIEPIDIGDFALLGDLFSYLAMPPQGHAAERIDPSARPLRAYLRSLYAQTRSIEIQGIGTGRGHGKNALSYPIEELYTPLRTRRGSERGLHAPGDELVTLCAVFPLHQHLLIEGQPGAGKTTFLRLVASLLARDALGIPTANGKRQSEENLGLDENGPAVIPIFLRASQLVSGLDEAKGRLDRALLTEFIEQLCCDGQDKVDRRAWGELLETGRACLLLDGVDEVSDPELRKRLFQILRDAKDHWPSRLIVSSRPIDTEAFAAMGFAGVSIEPFGRKEISQFVERWVKGLREIQDSGGAQSLVEQHCRDLTGAILANVAVRSLAENPVMLTCLCVVHFNEGRLPEGRSRLNQAVIEWLLRARSEQRKNQGYSDEFARQTFARLAFRMLTTEQGKRSTVSFGEAAKLMAPELVQQFPKSPSDVLGRIAERWLEFECEMSGIVQQLPGRQLRFWHLTFQEYLAALYLSWQLVVDETWWTEHVLPHLEDAQWRETIDVLPGCLYDGPGIEAVHGLFRKIVAKYGTDEALPNQARLAALLSRLLLPLGVYEYVAPPEVQSTLKMALDRSMAIFTIEGAKQVPIETRIEVADALGRAGDPRFASGVDNFLPVPGTGIKLGKYPVTVEEYKAFVDARGYEEFKWWSAEGWAARSKNEWVAPGEWEQQLQHPNRPVVMVSWFEAEAYCRWRSDQYGQETRLPRDEEWQKAATSPQGDHPWGGDEANRERANFADEAWRPNVGHPTPVGVYPSGAGPYGHLDLAGNVWEWTETRCDDAGTVTDRSQHRITRGGSWANRARYSRPAHRDVTRPHSRGSGLGFRLVAVQ